MSLAWSSVKALSIPVGGVARDVKRVSVGGTVLWEKAPAVPYDAEVEYLESTGTQYIDTGYVFTDTDCLSVDTMLTDNSGVHLHGMVATGGQNRFGIGRGSSSWTDWYFGLGEINKRTGVAINTNRHTLVLDGNADTAYIDGTAYAIGHAAWGTITTPACGATLFARANVSAGTFDAFWVGRLYAAQIRNNGASGPLVRDFQPVRVGSGASAVGYLYDRANPTGGQLGNGLYGSATATPLVAGPDKTT